MKVEVNQKKFGSETFNLSHSANRDYSLGGYSTGNTAFLVYVFSASKEEFKSAYHNFKDLAYIKLTLEDNEKHQMVVKLNNEVITLDLPHQTYIINENNNWKIVYWTKSTCIGYTTLFGKDVEGWTVQQTIPDERENL